MPDIAVIEVGFRGGIGPAGADAVFPPGAAGMEGWVISLNAGLQPAYSPVSFGALQGMHGAATPANGDIVASFLYDDALAPTAKTTAILKGRRATNSVSTTQTANNTYAIRTSTGTLKAKDGAANDDVATFGQLNTRLSAAQRTAINALTAIATPATATAQDCANKINAIIAALKA